MGILRLVKSDLFKMKHTPYYFIHIFIPVLGAVLFFLYYNFTQMFSEEYFLETVGIVFPILIGIVTSSVIKQEAVAGNYKEMIGTEFGRSKTLLSKIIMLLISGLLSLGLAVSCFVIGYKFGLKRDVMDFKFYLCEVLIIFTCVIFTYIFHLILSLEFGGAASIGFGIFETLVAEIMMTGIGEDVWAFIPCAWAARGSVEYYKYSIMGTGNLYDSLSNINIVMANVIIATVIITAIIFIRFEFYKGKIEN